MGLGSLRACIRHATNRALDCFVKDACLAASDPAKTDRHDEALELQTMIEGFVGP